MVLCRRVAVIICPAVVAVTASAAAQVVPLPSGKVSGGIVDDDGRARIVILAGDEGNDSTYASLTRRPVVIELGKGRVVGEVTLGEELAGLSLGAFLDSGDILLTGSQGPVDMGGYTAAGAAIVSVRSDEVERRWRWYSRTDFPECKSHCAVPEVSRDGRMWAFGWDQGNPESGAVFEIGWIGEPNDSRHMEHVDFPNLSPSASPDGSRHFWFLDTSDDLVVLVPWRGGGYIVHFRTGASPQVIPVLQGAAEPSTHWWDSSSHWRFHWQHGDRVLWAEADEQLRAYNLWDLGMSGFPDDPFWELNPEEGWEVHPERGLVRIVSDEGTYRIEHAWRDPWAGLEERHRSGSVPWPPPHWRVLVSANGRHAVVLESRESDDSADGTPVRTRNQARRLAMTIQPSAPPIPAAAVAPTQEDAGDPAEQPPKPPPER